MELKSLNVVDEVEVLQVSQGRSTVRAVLKEKQN